MLKGKVPDHIIRNGSESYNAIAAQWRKEVYYMLKRSITKEEQFIEFWIHLDNKLRLRLTKNKNKREW